MRTGKQAAKAFKNQNTNRVGLCLWEVQAAFQAPHMYPSAWSQWQNARKKHTGRKDIPIGAPVYFQGGQHGHIAIYVGGGMVRSTDAGGAGRMATVPLDWFRSAWGYPYAGWSADLGGQNIDFDTTRQVHVKKLKPGVDNSDSVMLLRRRLIKRGFLKVDKPLSEDRPGNKYTAAVGQAVAKWQRKHGYQPTGVLTNKQARAFWQSNNKIEVVPE